MEENPKRIVTCDISYKQTPDADKVPKDGVSIHHLQTYPTDDPPLGTTAIPVDSTRTMADLHAAIVTT